MQILLAWVWIRRHVKELSLNHGLLYEEMYMNESSLQKNNNINLQGFTGFGLIRFYSGIHHENS